jgi:hypothetical protein
VAVSCIVGTLVAGLTLAAAWQQAIDYPYLNWEQQQTRRDLGFIDQAIHDYQEKKHALPDSLAQLASADLKHGVRRMDPDGTVRDGWGRPFVYTVSGNSYRVVSYGRDGKPGGVGLDADVSNVEPRPSRSRLTLQQFLEMREIHGAIWAAGVAGILACLIALLTVRPADVTRRGALSLIAKVAATVIATVFVGAFIAMLHFPTGH